MVQLESRTPASSPTTTGSPAFSLATRRLAALVFLAVLTLGLFQQLARNPTATLYSDSSDLLAMHLPAKRFMARSWQETGEVPLWCPYSFGGMPFVHDVQVAMFYPLHWPLLVIPEESTGAVLSWLVAVHVLIASWAMFAYASHRGLGVFGSTVAGLGYGFSAKWLFHILIGGHYIMTPLAWLPLAVLFLERFIEFGRLFSALVAGAFFSLLILALHPQVTFYAGLFLAGWSLIAAWDRVGGEHSSVTSALRVRLKRWLFGGVLAAIVAVGLGAVQLLPALEAAPHTTRAAGVGAEETIRQTLETLPGVIGPYWDMPRWETQISIGATWFLAAAIAAIVGGSRHGKEGTLALLLLVFCLGGGVLVQRLPGFRLFQIPSRMGLLLAFPVAFLAGVTTDMLFNPQHAPPEFRRRATKTAICVFCLLAAVIVASALGARAQGLTLRPHPYWFALIVLAPSALWLFSRRCSMAPGKAAFLWLGILATDLMLMVAPIVEARSLEDTYRLPDSVRELVENREAEKDGRWRVLDRGVMGRSALSPLGSALPLLGKVQLEPIQGYNSFDVLRYKQFLQYVAGSTQPVVPREMPFGYALLGPFSIENKNLLDLLGVKYVLQPAGETASNKGRGDPGRDPAWKPVGKLDRGEKCYAFTVGGFQPLPPIATFENTSVFPRVAIVGEAVSWQPGSDVLDVLIATDFRARVLVEGVGSGKIPPGSARSVGSARIASYSPNRIEVECNVERDGWLVLYDNWFPGWQASVDGDEVPLGRANYLFRCAPVPAGRHAVVFRFDPVSYRWGKYGTLAALSLLMGVALLAAWSGIVRARAKRAVSA